MAWLDGIEDFRKTDSLGQFSKKSRSSRDF